MNDEVWAEEEGIRLRVESADNGSVVFSVVDTSPGWPGTVVAKATVSSFRLDRINRIMRGEPRKGGAA
jgi:hypothetical protein